MQDRVGNQALWYIASDPPPHRLEIPVPRGSKILSAKFSEDGQLWMYYLYDSNEEESKNPQIKDVLILATGQRIPDNDLYGWRFVDTALFRKYSYHVFVKVV